MQASSGQSPDKPAGNVKNILRTIIRQLRFTRVSISNFGKVRRGSNVYFGKNADVYIPTHGEFGQNVSIGSDWLSQVDFFIGDDCLISSRVSFIGHDHELFDSSTTSYMSGRLPSSKIILEGNNFIGFGATILGNITIGKDALVAAGALVNKDVPAGCVVAGVPAKVLSKRYK